MSNFRRCSILVLCCSLCLNLYACSGNPSTLSTSSSASSQSEQDEINAAFEEAVERYKGTTYAKGEETIEASDASMFSDDAISIRPTLKNARKSSLEYERVYEVRKDASGKVTEDKQIEEIGTMTTTLADGTVIKTKIYFPGNGFLYFNGGPESKSKMTVSRNFNSTDKQYQYLNLECLENLRSTKNGSNRVFEFEINQNGSLDRWFDFYAREDGNVTRKHYSGKLTVDDATGKITLELWLELQNEETGHTLKMTHKSVCDNTTPELNFPDNLESYKETERE